MVPAGAGETGWCAVLSFAAVLYFCCAVLYVGCAVHGLAVVVYWVWLAHDLCDGREGRAVLLLVCKSAEWCLQAQVRLAWVLC
jgi:hypothetical protein